MRIATPLREDELLLQGFSGREEISRPFRFDLRLLSENSSISFDALVGKAATVTLLLPDGTPHHINGIISNFSQGGRSGYLTRYNATLVPWLWLLTRTSDCRIFQNMTAPEIIEKVFKDFGFDDFKNKLQGSHETRVYCTQYRETAFDFVSRLMEHEGIFYYFEHEERKHTLVLANSPAEFKPCPNLAGMDYEANAGRDTSRETVTEWTVEQEVRPGKYTLVDFDFEKPTSDLTASVEGADERKYEIYDYPGGYKTRDHGDALAGLRAQEQDLPRLTVRGAGNYAALSAGYKVDLARHYRRDLNRSYALLSVEHQGDLGDSYETERAQGDFSYTNRFLCAPHPTPFRPARLAPTPVVRGTQTAIVVGPAGEEIYADKYGRVKVQFHWDRDGKYNENSSCWVRVSQNWAGKRWGAMFLPRIGQEVIVDFLEGDPDQPIVTGRVYNGGAMPPYALPDHKTMSTVKTYSSKGGGGFNELRFEDKKGAEQIFIHAQRNQDIRVRSNLYEFVGNDSHRVVVCDHFEHVRRHKHLIVDENHLEKIKGDQDLLVAGERTEEVQGKRQLTVKGDKLEKVEGAKHVNVAGDSNEKVGKKLSLNVGMELHEKVGMNYAHESGMNVHLKAGMSMVIEAGMQLTLKAAGGFITIGPAGVSISGPTVLINSGGAAGAGSGASPTSPAPPEAPEIAEPAHEADTAEPGQAAQLPPPKTPGRPARYSPAALVMQQAAQNGTPFCDI